MGIDKYIFNDERLFKIMEDISADLKENNALLRRLIHKDMGIPKQVKKDMIIHELLNGKLVKTKTVMAILTVSRHTAINIMTEIARDKKYILKDYKGNKGLTLALRR